MDINVHYFEKSHIEQSEENIYFFEVIIMTCTFNDRFSIYSQIISPSAVSSPSVSAVFCCQSATVSAVFCCQSATVSAVFYCRQSATAFSCYTIQLDAGVGGESWGPFRLSLSFASLSRRLL